jgi:ATP-binding cassette, subfamily B, bacterial
LIDTYKSLLGKYLRPQLGAISLLAVLLLAGIGLQLAAPQVIRFFLDTAQAGSPGNALFYAALVFIGFSVLQRLAALASGYLSDDLSWRTTNALRKDLALHCLRLDMGFHKTRTPGELLERIDGDVSTLGNFLSQFWLQITGNGLLIAGILVVLFIENWILGLSMAVYTLFNLAFLGLLQRFAARAWTRFRQAIALQNGFLEERISGVEEIRAAGAEQHTLNRFYAHLRQILTHARLAFVWGNLTFNLTHLLYALSYAISLGAGGYLYLQGRASLGAVYMIIAYIAMLVEPLQNIREQAQDFQSASAGAHRVQELLALQPETGGLLPVKAGNSRQPSFKAPGPVQLEFDHLDFHYDDAPNVLEQVSFRIEPGKTLGVLGRTGSGKTTLTRLLFRLYDPQNGEIRLNDRSLKTIPLAEVRSKIGLVTQDVQLFRASVRDNLTFFNPAWEDRALLEALRELGLQAWFERLPAGLDTVLGSGGQGLSAGEAQLLAFTRLFLKDPGLVVLDEASSRLDPATETLLEQVIDRLFEGRTALIIAHRLKTIQKADDILILENGRVLEYGSRRALAADPHSRFSRLLQTGLEEALA